LAESLEPDWVLMVRDNAGKFRVRGGVVVFPSHWSLPEKVGLTLLETHGVVPGLNAAVGTAIDRFLDRLKPGTGAERYNWGLAATAELNLHPALSRPRLSGTPDPNGTWLRVEHQILFVLPDTAAIVFGIRIHLFPLAEILQSRQIKTGLHRILTSMPPTLQTYKGLTPAMPWLLDVTS
jgi:hypothetical protein